MAPRAVTGFSRSWASTLPVTASRTSLRELVTNLRDDAPLMCPLPAPTSLPAGAAAAAVPTATPAPEPLSSRRRKARSAASGEPSADSPSGDSAAAKAGGAGEGPASVAKAAEPEATCVLSDFELQRQAQIRRNRERLVRGEQGFDGHCCALLLRCPPLRRSRLL